VRQAILVVALVAASFLGGAFVNGPGLRWAQSWLMRSLGLNGRGEIAMVKLTATANSETISDGSGPANVESNVIPGPLASMPPVLAEGESTEHDASGRQSGSQLQPNATYSGERSLRSPLLSLPFPLLTTPSPALTKCSLRAYLDRLVTPTSAECVPTSSFSSSRETQVAPALLDSLAPLSPSTPFSTGSLSPSSSRSPSALKSVVEDSDEWAILERRMQTLGVRRFTMEAEPGGRVVFSCLIPLAGRDAVAQRFEAEGDDLVQAVHATLRRIALWRATQAPAR
jgi:hypothetical protein